RWGERRDGEGLEALEVRRFRAGRSRPLDLRPDAVPSRPASHFAGPRAALFVGPRAALFVGPRAALSVGPRAALSVGTSAALSAAGGSIANAAGKSWWIHPQETGSV